MSIEMPFDPGPDRALGDLLREALTPNGNAEFVSHVLARLPAAGSFWDVLAGWARPGIAAAILLAAEQALDRDAMASVVLGTGR